MRTSTILLAVAAVLLTAAAAAIGFFAGQGSVSVDHALVTSERTEVATTSLPTYAPPVAGEAAASNPRADLILALGQPEPERARAVRLAINRWLAADGAAAIMAARDDPALGDAANRMTQLALYVYPEIFLDNPALLEGVPEQTIAMAVSGIAVFNPDAAREMVETHLSGSMFGDAMLSMVGEMGRQVFSPRSVQDPHAELESILSERNMMKRIPRLHALVARVAADDPSAAAELLDELPGSLVRQAIHPLVEAWSRTNPEEAARWLADRNARFSEDGLGTLAWRWGQSDFEAANAFADTLTGRKRTAFLTGLVNVTAQRMSTGEMLAWVSGYENDPAHANMVMHVAQHLVQEDIGAAMDLIETLPDEMRASSYRSILSSFAFQDPEAAIDLVDEIGSDSLRDEMLPMISSVWGHNDAESALDWATDLARGPARDRAIASIIPSLMDFDSDRAIEAIDEIEDPEVRRGPVWQLLFTAETDDEAIRLGRDYGFDRDAVLEVREQRRGMGGVPGPGFFAPYPASVSVGLNELRDADPE